MDDEIADKSKPKEQQSLRRYWIWALLLAVVLLAALIRFRLRETPLERDEGEYAYGGQLVLQGLPSDAPLCNIKPGMYAAYALIESVFGQTHSGIHLGLLVINAATIFVLFLLARRLFGPDIAVATAAAYAILSLGEEVLGFTANREHFVILPALGGILLVLRAVDRPKRWSLLAGAVLLGISITMKVMGLFFIVFTGLYLLFREIKRKPFDWRSFLGKGVSFTFGVMLPYALICLVLWQVGMLRVFCLWTFVYDVQYASQLPIVEGLRNLIDGILTIAKPAVVVWVVAGIGLSALLWNRKARKQAFFTVGFTLFSFLAVCPGLYFRPHYFVLLLPAIALLAGIGADCLYRLLAPRRFALAARLKPLLLVIILLSQPVYGQRNYLFTMSPTMISRTRYGRNPFVESLEIASYIGENSSTEDQIAVLGSEPQIYFYSKRHSATSHMYTHLLMGDYDVALKLQEEVIREIEAAEPRFLIFVKIPISWLTGPRSERLIFRWFAQYRQKYYRRVGVIDMQSPTLTVYRWGDQAIAYEPLSDCWIEVFQREDYKNDNEMQDADSDL